MKLSDFDYELPAQLIAESPVNPRDHSRLLILDQQTSRIEHKKFFDIIDYLNPGDLLIMNNTRVIPARLIGEKQITHGKVELLLHKQIEDNIWEALGRNIKVGGRIIFNGSDLEALPIKKSEEIYTIRFNLIGADLMSEIERIGLTPIPSYIRQGRSNKSDVENYQTVYAKTKGSVAAPTAGLHFTKSLIEKIKKKKIGIDFITLHAGLGTFAPVKTDNILEHKMHSEFFEIENRLIERIRETKKKGGRIIAVGTTTARVLESVFSSSKKYGNKTDESISGWTDIFIFPGYKFKCVNSLITNFHLPKSTLLLLVSALAGVDNIKRAYTEAIKSGYRFYSYGDAMLIK